MKSALKTPLPGLRCSMRAALWAHKSESCSCFVLSPRPLTSQCILAIHFEIGLSGSPSPFLSCPLHSFIHSFFQGKKYQESTVLQVLGLEIDPPCPLQVSRGSLKSSSPGAKILQFALAGGMGCGEAYAGSSCFCPEVTHLIGLSKSRGHLCSNGRGSTGLLTLPRRRVRMFANIHASIQPVSNTCFPPAH